MNLIESKGIKKNSRSYNWIKFLTGWGIKCFSLFVVFQQEKGRIVRWIYDQTFKHDSSLEIYNLFTARSELVGDR